MKKNIAIGGQAVKEGVVMRGPENIATALRRKDGTVEIKKEKFLSITKKKKIFNIPVVRGFVSLIEMFSISLKTLEFSFERAELDEPGEVKKKSKFMSTAEAILTYVVSFALALAIFSYLPYQVAYWSGLQRDSIYFNIFTGIFRILLFIVYVWLISLIKEIARIFEFHGAEHKVVSAYEKDKELSYDYIKDFSTLHPRCGTSFVFIVLIISIFVFSIIDFLVKTHFGVPGLMVRIGYHLLFIPVISGISYEVLKVSAKFRDNAFVKILLIPGMLLQRITTKEPDQGQVEVAVFALKSALDLPIEEPAMIRFLGD